MPRGLALFAIVFVISACNKTETAVGVGSQCVYNSFEGRASIISIVNAPVGEDNCSINPKKVTFVFTPNDISWRLNYNFKGWSDTSVLKINGSTNPSQAFLDSLNISVGSNFICKRKEIKNGTCTPVVFDFTTVDLFPKNGCR